MLKLLDSVCPNCLVKVSYAPPQTPALLPLPLLRCCLTGIALQPCAPLLSQRQDTNEVEVNVDLLTGRAFREASALTSSILPDVVLASGGRRGSAKATSAVAPAAVVDMQEE